MGDVRVSATVTRVLADAADGGGVGCWRDGWAVTPIRSAQCPLRCSHSVGWHAATILQADPNRLAMACCKLCDQWPVSAVGVKLGLHS